MKNKYLTILISLLVLTINHTSALDKGEIIYSISEYNKTHHGRINDGEIIDVRDLSGTGSIYINRGTINASSPSHINTIRYNYGTLNLSSDAEIDTIEQSFGTINMSGYSSIGTINNASKINLSGDSVVGIINTSTHSTNISMFGNASVHKIKMSGIITLSGNISIDKIKLNIGDKIKVSDKFKAKKPILIRIDKINKAIKKGRGIKLLETSGNVKISDVINNFKLDSNTLFINSVGNIDFK